MDRRLIGALLVAAVVAVAILVPARDGLRIAGGGTAMKLPPDPQIGDCLLDTAHFGPCAGQSVMGEVVAVAEATRTGSQQLHVQYTESDCRAAALTYAGLTRVADHFVPNRHPQSDPVSWEFSINVSATWVLPSSLEQAAGRRWAACVARPGGGGNYVGGLAGAYNGGRLPDAFGVCWKSREVSPSLREIDCREPHLAELIALGEMPRHEDTTPSKFRDSCRSLAAEVMGRDDPTANGGLTIVIDPEAADYSRWTQDPMSVVCYLVPTTGALAGTLVGLGERPVPYSG